jgi:hypothetical protein
LGYAPAAQEPGIAPSAAKVKLVKPLTAKV